MKTVFQAAIFLFFALAVWVPSEDYGSSKELSYLRYASYALLAGVLAFLGFRKSISRIRKYPSFMMLTALVLYWVISTAWSQAPLESVLKSTFLILTLLAALALLTLQDGKSSYQTVVGAISCFVVASALVCLAFPEVGLENSYQHAGKWRGLSGQKNRFGLACATTIVLLMAPADFLPKPLDRKLLRLAVISLAAVCLWNSGSRGALVDLVAAVIGIGYVLIGVRARLIALGIPIMAAVALGALAITELSISGGVMTLADYTIDTSNRLVIWGFAFDEWQGREILGVGYGGFWTEEARQSFETLNGWALPNFHNGYISLLIETGILGAFIFAAFCCTLIYRIFKHGDLIKRGGGYPSVGIIFMFLAHNLYENNLTRSTDFFMLTFFISIALIDSLVAQRSHPPKTTSPGR